MGGGFLLRAGASMSLKSGISVAWILAFARMTAGGGVKGSGFFHRWGLLVFLKSGIHAAWMLAFASMTAGGESASGTPLYRHPWA